MITVSARKLKVVGS